MTTFQKCLRGGVAICAVGVAAYVGWRVYDSYTWARDRRAIASEADAEATPYDICLAVHAPKLTHSDLDRLEAKAKVLRESYDKRFMRRTRSGLAFSSRTRADARRYHFPVLGIDCRWEDAATCIRLLAYAPESERAEIESSFREMERILSELAQEIEGARVIVHGIRDTEKEPNQALQTTSVTRSGFGKVPVSDPQRRGV